MKVPFKAPASSVLLRPAGLMRLRTRGANQSVRPSLNRFGEFAHVVGDGAKVVNDLIEIFRVRIHQVIQSGGEFVRLRESLLQLITRLNNLMDANAENLDEIIDNL